MEERKESRSTPVDERTVASAVNDYLQSSTATRLLEGKVVEYALERKSEDVLKSYLAWRIFPSLTAVAVVLAYLGWDMKDGVTKLSANLDAKLKEVSAQQKDVQDRRDRLDAAMRAAETQYERLEQRLNTMTGRADRQMSDASDRIFRYATSSADKLARAEEAAKTASKVTDDAASSARLLSANIKEATDKARSLEAKLQLQARLINTAILEVISVNDRTTSGVIELPQLDQSPSRLSFTAKEITKRKTGPAYVELLVHLDGVDSAVRIEATSDGQWRKWRRLALPSSNYEYRVDHVYYDEKANDFVSIHVRATKEFAESLMKSETPTR